MRISDWSSDVCSSDLVGTHKAIRIQEQGVVIAAGEIFDHSVERTGRGTETIPIGWRYQRKVLVPHLRARVWAVPIAQAVARPNDSFLPLLLGTGHEYQFTRRPEGMVAFSPRSHLPYPS